MQPNQGSNPFLALLAQQQGDGQPPMGGGNPIPSGAQPQPQGPQIPDPNAMPPSTERGQSGDLTKELTDALRAMHNYLSSSIDREDISIGRSIIALLSQLILRDQKKAQQTDQQGQQQGPINQTMLPGQGSQPGQ